jgi:CDP-glycerol glycerophosphotransferase (TagB/SpsB family)
MEKTKLPVHYITEKKNIYLKYCKNQIECLTIILVNHKNYIMNGDFLEKYLILFLRLKQVISGGGTNFDYNNNNLFYNIDYITYICVGHGISFFKSFLYSDYSCYGSKRYNKILIPPWKNLMIIVKMYGWNENNIIKMNLPKWDKYNNDNFIKKNNHLTNNSSIFLMFTWRKLEKKQKISKYYFRNFLALLTDIVLNKALNKKKIILYFTLHHKLKKYIKKTLNKLNKLNHKYVKFIEENEIFECLSKTNLLVSDFSSVIFDLIYRRKPFIIYIPDLEDPKIKDLYVKDYYELIESIKNGTIEFENKCFSINETINKIIYYINNNFSLEKKLENYYNNFNFKKDKNINKFINYLKNLK